MSDDGGLMSDDGGLRYWAELEQQEYEAWLDTLNANRLLHDELTANLKTIDEARVAYLQAKQKLHLSPF